MSVLGRTVVHLNIMTVSRLIEGYMESCDVSKGLVNPKMDEQASAELRKVGKHFNPHTFLASISVPDYRRAILAMAQNETKVDEVIYGVRAGTLSSGQWRIPERVERPVGSSQRACRTISSAARH